VGQRTQKQDGTQHPYFKNVTLCKMETKRQRELT
jgi:hypothetical protein